MTLDEVDRFVRQPRGEVAFVVNRREPAVQRRFVIGEVEVVVGTASEKAVELIEAARRRVVRFGQPEVPLAERSAHIAGGLEVLREDLLIERQSRAPFTGRVDADTLLIATGHQPGTCRRTDVAADVPL